MGKQRAKIDKIIKEWKDASPKEVWEGVRDNFLFGFIGMPLALMYLPFRGLELQVLGVLILIISIYFTGKSINGSCKVK